MRKHHFIVAFVLLMTASCEKNEIQTDETFQTAYIHQEAFAENIFDEVFELTHEAHRKTEPGLKNDFRRLGPCAEVTLDTTVMPHVLTIDFGPENCMGPDGNNRRGQIIISFNQAFPLPGSLITTTFNEYHVNDNHVQGTKTRENTGFNEDGFIQFHFTVDGSVTLAANGETISRQADHIRFWIEGFESPQFWFDDVHLITGQATTTHSLGWSATRTIINPLRKEMSCPHFVSGTVEIERTGRPTALLDYGDGECDDLATITIGDNTFVIELP